MSDELIVAVIVFGGFGATVIYLTMKKRIIRFLRNLGLWKKAKEFKEKPEKPTDPIEEPELPEQPEPPKQEYHITLDPDIDNTKSLQDQLDAIPDGELLEGSADILEVVGEGNEWQFEIKEPKIKWVDIYLPEGEFWTEGIAEPQISPYDSKKIEGSWVTLLRERKYIRIHGNNTTFYTKAPAIKFEDGNVWKGRYSHRRHFALKRCENVEIYGLTIKGSNYTEGSKLGRSPEHTPPFWTEGTTIGGASPGYPGYVGHFEFEHGFDINNSRNIRIENCKVSSVWGDGYYQTKSENIIIRNSTAHFIGRMGWATAEGGRTLLDGLHFNWIRWSGIDFECDDPSQKIEFVEVKNSKWEYNQLYAIPAAGNGDISNINIHHNDLSQGGLYCRINDPQPDRPETWIIRKNWRFNDNINVGTLKMVWMDNVKLNRNVFTRWDGIFFKPTAIRNLEIKDNKLNGKGIKTAMCGLSDIEPYASERAEVSGNTPEPVIFDETPTSTEEGKLLYEQMKQHNL